MSTPDSKTRAVNAKGNSHHPPPLFIPYSGSSMHTKTQQPRQDGRQHPASATRPETYRPWSSLYQPFNSYPFSAVDGTDGFSKQRNNPLPYPDNTRASLSVDRKPPPFLMPPNYFHENSPRHARDIHGYCRDYDLNNRKEGQGKGRSMVDGGYLSPKKPSPTKTKTYPTTTTGVAASAVSVTPIKTDDTSLSNIPRRTSYLPFNPQLSPPSSSSPTKKEIGHSPCTS